MPYYRSKNPIYIFWVQVRRYVWILIGLAVMGGIWWQLSRIGPRAVGTGEIVVKRATAGELEKLREEVDQLVAVYRKAGANADVQILKQAIARQEEVVAHSSGGGQADVRRLLDLEQDLAAFEAKATQVRIDDLGRVASKAQAAGDLAAADRAWREALELQRGINRSAAPAAQKSFVRQSQIEQQLDELVAEPIAAEVDKAFAAAKMAAKEERWADALSAFSTARANQARLNTEFARSKYVNLVLMDQIDREIASLDAAGAAAEVDAQEAAGDAALAAGEYHAAVEAFTQARDQQVRINQEYSRSLFLSSPRVERLEVKRQKAESIPLIAALRAEDGEISGLLRKREAANAGERAVALERQIREAYGRVPKSDQLDSSLLLKYAYLATQRERLREIQDVIYERLRPLAGASELRMFRTEFPQSLYLQLMKVNPSRNPGRSFPVDSVSWFDAQQCCQRLSWILGWKVRLPTLDEFRVALGDASLPTAEKLEKVRPKASVEVALNEPNPDGFYDLLGNVAEWLDAAESEMGGDPAPVAGGSYLDPPEALATVLTVNLPRSDRARHVGFRIVVEMPGN